ncbi:hypothetical protein NGH74_12275 [Staphylococcus pseudoxylosus]|uniref:hypothetical protein n=1 Tax=Staphylococcus pseudoxylosus TaxID=2282419 RepID=UPI000D1D3D73|nr:hypothetical protein [Staphylococcus pseudoxylosus]MDW8798310.1 hypothetical protein [Staphylococcus pseudoxylosus]MEB8087955.1 hypothetical protein [Staphylococcus pseudoxylosus]PTI44580.1 hypothetical protein BU120_08515 [Staphylococcus xylosus]
MNLHRSFKLLIVSLFMAMGIGTILIVNYINNTQSTNLSQLTIDNMKLDIQIDAQNYTVYNHVVMKNHRIYTKGHEPHLTFKVNKKDGRLKGITLVKDTKIETNFNASIDGDIQSVINQLGDHYKNKQLHKSYKVITYCDKVNQIKLSIVYKHDKIKKIEFYKK